MKYTRFKKISLKNHASLNEQWVQDRIAEDPSILGLGDVILRDRERIQPRAGRLDLLLQDASTNRRYEVELQLGATDPSHIIRTIEYWDIERKRYPYYDHVAVLVAEDITSRFLNVVSLFNGFIPIVAIQMSAIVRKTEPGEEEVGLIFTTVLDQTSLGLVSDDDDEAQEVTDRSYWESRASKKTVSLADKILEIIRQHDPTLDLSYKKHYIGLANNGRPSNFVVFRPKKHYLKLEPRIPPTSDLLERLDASDLDVMDYDARWGRARIRIRPDEFEDNRAIIEDLIKAAYEEWTAE